MTSTWIVVADAARARVFSVREPGGEWAPALASDLVGDAGPSREIGSDRPGRVFDSHGAGRHAMEERTDPHKYEVERFAREIGRVLDEERKRHSFERLVLVAPPVMLGELRAQMPAELRALIVADLAKDLSKVPVKELAERLHELLHP